VPSDPGPGNVSDEPPFGSLQFTVLEVSNTAVDPEKFCFGVCIATLSALQQVTGILCGSSLLLHLFLRVGSAMMCRTIVGIARLSTVGKLFELLVYRH
jgi:hypothetical protein